MSIANIVPRFLCFFFSSFFAGRLVLLVIAVALSGLVGLAIGELIQTSLLISALTFSSKRTLTDRERSSVLATIQTHCYTYLRYTRTHYSSLWLDRYLSVDWVAIFTVNSSQPAFNIK